MVKLLQNKRKEEEKEQTGCLNSSTPSKHNTIVQGFRSMLSPGSPRTALLCCEGSFVTGHASRYCITGSNHLPPSSYWGLESMSLAVLRALPSVDPVTADAEREDLIDSHFRVVVIITFIENWFATSLRLSYIHL